jgi:hypothetical protein
MAKGKASPIVLSAEERRELTSLVRRRSTGQALALRSRIVLAAADGGPNGEIAERLGVFPQHGRRVARALCAAAAGRSL